VTHLGPCGGGGVDILHQHLAETAERLRDELLERGAGGHVEPVKCVVQHEQLRLGRQCLCEENLFDLAARDGADRTVEDRVQAEAHDQIARRRAERAERPVDRAALGEERLVRLERDARHGAAGCHGPAVEELLANATSSSTTEVAQQRERGKRLAAAISA